MIRTILLNMIALATALMIASPVLARTDCKKDFREFDAAMSTTKASKADVAKAMKLRHEAGNDCLTKAGTAKGDADMKEAMKLIHAS